MKKNQQAHYLHTMLVSFYSEIFENSCWRMTQVENSFRVGTTGNWYGSEAKACTCTQGCLH